MPPHPVHTVLVNASTLCPHTHSAVRRPRCDIFTPALRLYKHFSTYPNAFTMVRESPRKHTRKPTRELAGLPPERSPKRQSPRKDPQQPTRQSPRKTNRKPTRELAGLPPLRHELAAQAPTHATP